MASESNFSRNLPVDRSLAMQIVEASRHEHSGAASSASKSQNEKRSADTASIASKSSFGSTVGLLKSKLHSKSKSTMDSDAKKMLEQQRIMRNQVNIVG